VVYEDVNGDGVQDIYSGELGIAGWDVDLYWNGQVIASTVSASDGSFSFTGLGITGTAAAFSVCLGAPPANWAAAHVQTEPSGAMANGCSGTGYAFSFPNVFMTVAVTNFGEQLVPVGP
jgi:hypothetical protein